MLILDEQARARVLDLLDTLDVQLREQQQRIDEMLATLDASEACPACGEAPAARPHVLGCPEDPDTDAGGPDEMLVGWVQRPHCGHRECADDDGHIDECLLDRGAR